MYDKRWRWDFCYDMQAVGTYEQVFSGARAAVLLSDTDGVALYANDTLEKKTGFSLGEVVGRAPGKLWGGHMPRVFYDGLWETIGSKQEPFVAELTNAKKNTERYDELLAIAPLFGKDHTAPEYYLAVQAGYLAPGEARERFTRSFKSVFSRRSRVSSDEKFRFLSTAAGSRFVVPSVGSRSLTETFKELFVAPLESRFSARFEDRALVMAAKEDPERFRALYEKYHGVVAAYFMRHAYADRDMIEDLVQDTFFRGFFYLDGFRIMNASYGTYLLRIAHNVLINYFRKKQAFGLVEDIPENHAVEVLFSEEALWRSPGLSSADQRVLTMKYREGYAVREIASEFGVTENAVKLRLSRARKRLRVVLGDD